MDYYKLEKEEWFKLIRTNELSEEFLTCHASHFDDDIWRYVTQYQSLSSHFIYRFQNYLDIRYVIKTQRIHQETIRKYWYIYKDYQEDLLTHQYLSEEFINAYADEIDWKYVFLGQLHISFEFLRDNLLRAFEGQYIPSDDIPIHKNLVSPRVLHLISDHNKHLEKMSRINVSAPKRKKLKI